MKILLQRLLLMGAIILTCLVKISGQSTTKAVIDKFFELYASDPSKAVEYGFSTNKWMANKPDDVDNLKNKLKNLIGLIGEYYGYEMVSEKTAGSRTKMITYLVIYDREPIRFSFFFYKPKDIWQLNNFSFDEDIDKDLEEASKAYRLKENMDL